MGTVKVSGELSAPLKGARRRFERWRRTRKPKSRIPETLWACAVRTARREGIHRTAKALLFDYYSLKKRVEEKPATAAQAPERSANTVAASPPIDTETTFVELPSPPWADSNECTLELEDPSGSKMRIHLRGIAAPDLAALSRTFWDRGS